MRWAFNETAAGLALGSGFWSLVQTEATGGSGDGFCLHRKETSLLACPLAHRSVLICNVMVFGMALCDSSDPNDYSVL